MSDISNWTETADQWIAWAGTENHDAFWAYRSAFETFVGRGEGAAVEIGAGEGRISRVLGELGWRVTLVEPVPALLEAAREAGSGHAYIGAPGHDVPLESGGYDLVMLYNMLMDVDDVPGTVAEAARLLAPGGRMVVGIVHPIADLLTEIEAGGDQSSYFTPMPIDASHARDGLTMRFLGWRRPLAHYIEAFTDEGLVITRLAEPEPDPGHPATSRMVTARRRPIFLWLDLRRP